MRNALFLVGIAAVLLALLLAILQRERRKPANRRPALRETRTEPPRTGHAKGPMGREQILECFRNSPFSHLTPEIETRLKASVHLVTQPIALNDLPVGASRIGGVPDLPPGFAWPQISGEPLAFIAQLNLSDVKELDADKLLPASGWLCFFYGAGQEAWGFSPEDRGHWGVYYFQENTRDLKRRPNPTLPASSIFRSCAVKCEGTVTLPAIETLREDGVILQFSKEWLAYPPHPLDELLAPENVPCHRLLGNPDIIQNDMRLECQLASNGIYCGNESCRDDRRYEELRAGAQDWVLLLQIDTDENGPGWMCGDMGRIYYWIRKQDLAERHFDRAWLVLQCY